MKTTEELKAAVEKYQAGEKESFNKIYELSYPYLYTTIIHAVKEKELAMDMIQETYLEISKSILQLKKTETFLSWAAVIGTRKCFAYLQKKKDILLGGKDEMDEENYFESISDDEAFIPENILQDREKQRLIREIICGLSDMQRLCVIGYYYNEQSQEEIAEELNIPVNTVKSHLNRAKAKIKAAILELEEKKGTRLYSLAPFMLLFFTKEVEACQVPQMHSDLQKEITDTTDMASKKAQKLKGISELGTGAKIGILSVSAVVLIGAAALIAQKTSVPRQETVTEAVEENTEDESKLATDTERQETATEEITETGETGTEKEAANLEEALVLEGYESVGNAYGGVIPVKKNELWGAINYQKEEIVPCEYSGFYTAPNHNGYFVLYNSETVKSKGDFSFEYTVHTYTLFGPDGQKVYEGKDAVTASGNFYGLIKNEEDGGEGCVEYYTYDGELFLTTKLLDSAALRVNGFYEGKATLYQSTRSPEDSNQIKIEVGSLMEDGSVEWDKTPLYEGPEALESTSTYQEPEGGTQVYGSGAGIGLYHVMSPMSTMNHGYYVVNNIGMEPGYMKLYTDKQEEICNWHIFMLEADGNQLVSGSFNESNGIKSFFHDGDSLVNYGSKMVWMVDGRDFLVDLALAPGMTEETFNPDIVLTSYDGIYMNDSIYWLVQNTDQWGYIDQNGKEMAMYEDASDFCNGYALVKEKGVVYLIDENFEKVKNLGNGDSVGRVGEFLSVKTDEAWHLYKNGN